MSKISTVSHDAIDSLRSRMQTELKGCDLLEKAAQKYAEIMYDEFKDSIVLARVYATFPFGKLPASVRTFVTHLIAAQKVSRTIDDQMLVLSLLGTCGEVAAWRDRRQSKGHLGIPLASADFIEKIPMMSRLLKELGLDLQWLDSQDTEIVAKALGRLSGVFYVPEAKTTVDRQHRLIIAAQDFVADHHIATVFGVGGAYITSPTTFVTIIAFCRERLEKQQAERFIPLVNEFKSLTGSLVSSGHVFADAG